MLRQELSHDTRGKSAHDTMRITAWVALFLAGATDGLHLVPKLRRYSIQPLGMWSHLLPGLRPAFSRRQPLRMCASDSLESRLLELEQMLEQM